MRGIKIISIVALLFLCSSTINSDSFLTKAVRTVPLLLSASAIAWDGTRLARGEFADQTWTETASSCHKGLIGTVLLPFAWKLSPFGQKKKPHDKVEEHEEEENKREISKIDTLGINPDAYLIKPAEDVVFEYPEYDQYGEFLCTRQKNAHLGPRVFTQHNSLVQNGAECGYYAAYFANCFAENDFVSLNDRKKFDETMAINGLKSFISSEDIETLIKQDANIVIIDDIALMEQRIKNKYYFVPGIHEAIQSILDFRKGKSPLTIVLNTSLTTGTIRKTCEDKMKQHWFAVKLDKLPDDIILTHVADSLYVRSYTRPLLDRLCNLALNIEIENVETVGEI